MGAARIEHTEHHVINSSRVRLHRVVNTLLKQSAERVDSLVAEAGCEGGDRLAGGLVKVHLARRADQAPAAIFVRGGVLRCAEDAVDDLW
jgi:hypothetical protein